MEVALSAYPNPVEEGNSITVTASLSEALDSDVTIPLTLTNGTAGAQGYEAPPPVQIVIKAGQTIGTYSIFAVADDITEIDETFTVALGPLPSGLAGGIHIGPC